MDATGFLTVSEFSRFTHIPIDTIKYYDRIGILKPAYVGDNKYRYYLPEQALQLTRVIFGAKAGMPLNIIKQTIDTNDFKLSMEHYRGIYSKLEEKIQEFNAIRSTIYNLDYYYRLTEAHEPLELFRIYLPEWFMIYSAPLNINASPTGNDSNIANDLFFKGFYNNTWPHYQLGAFYTPENIAKQEYNIACFFLKTDHPEEFSKEELGFNPSGHYLCYFSYENGRNLALIVKNFFRLLTAEKKRIIGNVYAVNIINSLMTEASGDYCTMIYAKEDEDE